MYLDSVGIKDMTDFLWTRKEVVDLEGMIGKNALEVDIYPPIFFSQSLNKADEMWEMHLARCSSIES